MRTGFRVFGTARTFFSAGPLLSVSGVILLALALLVSSATLEASLGRKAGELSWGTTLFRVMLGVHGMGLLVAGLLGRSARRPAVEPGSPVPRSHWITLTALVLVGLGLRLYRLDTALWIDEILTVSDFVKLPFTSILTTFPNQNQHMLYSLAAHACVVLFGESIWAYRLPSVLFGVGSIWMLYFLGRRLVGGRAALLACTVMTFSYHHIWFSQNARGYMGLLFFSILATWLWLKAIEDDRWASWVSYSIACFLGAWIHMTMVFVAVSHALIWAGERLVRRFQGPPVPESPLRKPLTAWVLAATLTIQGHALALPEFLRTALHEASNESEWTNPLWVVTESIRNLQIGFSGTAVILCGAVFLLLGWGSILRRSPRAAFAMILAPILGAGLMLTLGHNLWPRFFFFAMGFALLIVAEGAFFVPRAAAWLFRPAWSGTWAVRAGTACMLLLSAASAATIPRCYAPKQDFPGARDFAEQIRNGQQVVAVGLAGKVYQRYLAPQWSFPETVAELQAIRQQSPNLILLYALPFELKAFHPEMWRVIERDFEIVRFFPGTLGGGEVFVCRPQSRPAPSVGSHPAIRGINDLKGFPIR